jgi:hypothetical protein
MTQTATITSIKREFNLFPNIVGIVTTADLTDITTTGYWTNESDNVTFLNNGVWTWEAEDIVLIYYATNQVGWFSYNASTASFVNLITVSFSPSNPSLSVVASVLDSGSCTVSNIPVFQDVDGTIGDSGVAINDVQLSTNIQAGATNDIGGQGAGPITVTQSGITANSAIVGTIRSSSNPVSIVSILPGSGSFAITFSGDPGVSCRVSTVAFIQAQ